MLRAKFIGPISLACLALAACGPTSTPAIDQQALFIDNAALVAEEQPAVLAASVEVTESSEAEIDHCLACHSDQQQLIDTAAPVVEAPKESEGAG